MIPFRVSALPLASGPESPGTTAKSVPASTPEPTPIPTTIPTVTPIFTPTPTATIEPTATTAPTPSTDCGYVSLGIAIGSHAQSGNADSVRDNFGAVPPGFSCLQTILDDAIERATQIDADYSARVNMDYNSSFVDDLIARIISERFFGPLPFAAEAFEHSVALTQAEQEAILRSHSASCYRKSVIHLSETYDGTNDTLGSSCVAGEVIIDGTCSVFPQSQLSSAIRSCGNNTVVFTKSSPVSLVWKEGADRNLAVTFVRFPLDLGARSAALTTWKASANLPLIVYDPEHKGVVSSPTQLFGNWTFGGKKTASLDTLPSALQSPWKDGFEALASLDTNNDLELSGSELNPLGLWFDGNQNGISEEGEIKRLTDTEVTALYFTPDSYSENTKTVRASRGFKKLVSGREFVGAAIDWFGGRGASESHIIAGVLGNAATTHSTYSLGDGSSGDEMFPISSLQKHHGDKLRGLWEWRTIGREGQTVPDGYLVMYKSKGVLQGIAITPTYMKPEGKDATMLSFQHFVPSIDGESTEPEASFAIRHGLSTINTVLKLGSDGSISGKTYAVAAHPREVEKMSYGWTAKKRETSKFK